MESKAKLTCYINNLNKMKSTYTDINQNLGETDMLFQ